MSGPRIFVSSTYYDLKHLRSSLENFIESLGYEPVLSEKGDIAYSPDVPLDESCYREVRNSEVFVLIVGGRYGSQASRGKKDVPSTFFERYDSITKKEYLSAVEDDIPTYILIESSVYAEFQTFLKNRSTKKISYAHVDSVNIFHLIEEILTQPRNNPIKTFERYSDIEDWLKEQWAGLFKELLKKLTTQSQISTLSTEVAELSEVNKTLKRYLEAVVTKVNPKKAAGLIEEEQQRLEALARSKHISRNLWVRHMTRNSEVPLEKLLHAIESCRDVPDLSKMLIDLGIPEDRIDSFRRLLEGNSRAQGDFNEAREILGAAPLPFEAVKRTKERPDVKPTHQEEEKNG